jgi:glycosyltransferase involved in cell wall biosynthesis
MQRPSISLAMIVKNEEHNLEALFKSIEGCFDEIHITDTGSTDGTVELAKKLGAVVHHFEWVNDFSKARNASFSHVTTDFVMWMDGDDLLLNRDAFIAWRDHAMNGADFWLATYNYAFTGKEPACSFARERVIRMSKNPQWKYFVHEGVMPAMLRGKVNANYATTWAINHNRTTQDIENDRSRNLNLFKEHEGELDSRMLYYYGKEFFEAGLIAEAIEKLKLAVGKKDLEIHDRILGIQYLCMSLMKQGEINPVYYQHVKDYATQGLLLMPQRAELFCFLGDAHIKTGQFQDAVPVLSAAKNCNNQGVQNGIASPIFTYKDVYTTWPRNQLTRIYAQQNDFKKAREEAEECLSLYPDNEEAKTLLAEINRMDFLLSTPFGEEECTDIVFTCPPMNLYEWDYDVYKQKGIGGSETALVEMADHLKKITGRRVVVFNTREKEKICNGVEYYPVTKTQEYFAKYKPALHIAWRHNIKVTNAKTYVWSHDLIPQFVQLVDRYEKVLCLSEFHKNYLHAMSGVPLDKIIVTRNGINPDRFRDQIQKKVKGKIVYSSSPDRGLDQALRVMDHVVKEIPEAKLHVYYGFDNMEKMGMKAEVDRFKAMISERPFVIAHGNLEQKELTKEFLESEVWLYPTYFLETFCITAIEALASGVYPVTRKYGALQDTLKDAAEQGMATLLDQECSTESQIQAYAKEVVDAISQEKWKGVKIDLNHHAWKAVAEEWLTQLM